MENLPLNNIPILVSYINCLLRDKEYDNLEQICDSFDVSMDEINKILEAGNYRYNQELNTIKPI